MKQTQKENNNRKNTKVIPGCFFFFLKQDEEDKRENYRKLQIILHSILVGCRKYWGIEGGKQQPHNVTSKLFPRWQKMNKKRTE